MWIMFKKYMEHTQLCSVQCLEYDLHIFAYNISNIYVMKLNKINCSMI